MKEKRIRRPRHVLRGVHLNEAVIRSLTDLESWSAETLTWENLAKRFGVSRQAIENKERRPAVYDAFHAAKAALKRGLPTSPDAVLKRTLADEIKGLRDTIKAKDRQLDAWAEKWASVEFNAHSNGINADLILLPLPSFKQ
jgi:hypothetical protein